MYSKLEIFKNIYIYKLLKTKFLKRQQTESAGFQLLNITKQQLNCNKNMKKRKKYDRLTIKSFFKSNWWKK